MKFSIAEYGRLDAAGKQAVEQWVVDHLGDYHGVKDVGVDGDVAWFERYLRNAEGNRYAVDGEIAKEVVRVSLKRPFPIQVSV